MADEKQDLKALGDEALKKLQGGGDSEPQPMSDFDRAAAAAKLRVTERAVEAKVKLSTDEPTAEDAMRLRKEKKARIAQVLSRGVLGEKLKSIIREATPDGYAGKFVRNDAQDIIRAQNLGFGFKYRADVDAVRLGLHATPDGKIRVGDILLMTITKEDQEILREVRTERMKAKLTKSKKEYLETSASHDGGPEAFSEGQTSIDAGRIVDRR
jgi:hypothetical protein